MHALHHSDLEFNITTSVRHYWAEHLLKTVTVYLAAGLLFRASPPIAFLYWLAAFYNCFVHMDLPIGFGRLGHVLNSPRYHRIHHSSLPEHAGCNYAGLFSLYDWLFGTYRPPALGERPPTGLVSGDRPASPLAALAWPLTRLATFPAIGTAR
jgi:sterol desaturase/sphingolipid hydroxylase (fatty acid hydroxylase superfamily)